MKQKILITMLLIFTIFATSAKDDKEKNESLTYEIEGAGTGVQGTYLVKVTVINNKSNISDDLIARCAVHGVLFRGFSNKELRQQHKPLAGSALVEQQHADFFKDFFKEKGTARNYVSKIEGARQVIKVDKEYKISATVTVNKELLHSDLESAGIIKGLNSGF